MWDKSTYSNISRWWKKKHPGGPSTSDQYTCDNRIYDCQFGDHSLLSLIKLYLSKLHPECTWLFQQHRTRALRTDNVWFKKEPLGINSIGKMMLNISKEAGLSRTYTSHSVRATTITILSGESGSHAGSWPGRDIKDQKVWSPTSAQHQLPSRNDKNHG